MTYNRGIPDNLLWSLYAAADCFLLTSKAEGLAIPLLEAMACGLPVVATDCTAMREHLAEAEENGARGWLIPTDYQYIDPFGNELRYWADREQGAQVLGSLADDFAAGRFESEEIKAVTKAALSYVTDRTYEKAAQITAEALERVIKEFAETRKTNAAMTTPPSIPPAFLTELSTEAELG